MCRASGTAPGLRRHRPPCDGRQYRADRRALLLSGGSARAFDLNDKKYGDDDLIVGSIDPYQLFRIAHELINAMRDDTDPVAQQCANDTVYMLDQCHNIEPKLPAMIRSVMNLQETIAKALLVDREALLAAQAAGDVLDANASSKTPSRRTSGRSSASCGWRAACPRPVSRLPRVR